MKDTARKIDLALAETLITQKETYSRAEYQEYKYVLLQSIIGESINNAERNFHHFTRSNRSRETIRELGKDGLIIELIKNALKFYAYVSEKTWCKLQTPINLDINSNRFNATNVVPFIVDEMKSGKVNELIEGMRNNVDLCEAAIASFVETRYERGLFNKELDDIYKNNEEICELMCMLDYNNDNEHHKRIA